MEAFCRDLLAAGHRILTLDLPSNAALIALGAEPFRAEDVSRRSLR
jgi:hypothetical protein